MTLYDIQCLGTEYDVRRITVEDISDVYRLCRGNRKYYEALGTEPTMASLTEVISRVPQGAAGKHFVGFYDGERLIAVLDLITGYPEKDDAFIGWFMVEAELQGRGIGSRIFADVRAAMKGQGYDYLSLTCSAENEQAIGFWQAQGFAPIAGETGESSTRTLGRDI